jgi:hypothetical protein
MTRDDIIRMAQEAGFVDYELDDGTDEAFDIRYVRFAILVATAENEACAKVCENKETLLVWPTYSAAIRARGQA